ncbi:hypothetical protein RG47T_2751 [Mucilaginibacter polytrichastri]|uniref:Prepilin type IV endopeptidase peptidase domain-containing protein n=2 Tax=Mucilaginibacter polytrichastri TaxID=1302689 RepID=A0A1Q5ZZZ6_9SPHI|nr:hypothetical protein [Mucilaginibacter polytrichastri]OKS87292.1 hypothetical protein RG47T_2751 [Mucilaginibacter polytrichastri]
MLVLIFLLIIFIEDMLSRSVHWFLFPMLYAALLITGYFSGNGLASVLQHSLYNTLFIVLQLVVLTVYFSIKSGKLTNIANGLLGWGDILLLISITVCFSLVNFVLFYTSSLIFVLLTWGMVNYFSKNKQQHIPLAGLQALVFSVLFIATWFHPAFDLNNDEWIINKLLIY